MSLAGARVTVLALLLLGAGTASAHGLPDAAGLQARLDEVARHHAASAAGDEAARAEALFRLGSAVEALVELMNHDLTTHGGDNLLAAAVVKRLGAYGVTIAASPRTRRYAYDLAAFAEYLQRAPAGRWAAEARWRFITARFHEAPLPDAPDSAGGDTARLLEAVCEEERFLRDYPGHDRTPLVRFYLAVDYYRVMQSVDGALAREYRERARRALEAVALAEPGSTEARAAEVLLERLRP